MKPEKFFNIRTFTLMTLLADKPAYTSTRKTTRSLKAETCTQYALSVLNQSVEEKEAKMCVSILSEFSAKVVSLFVHHKDKRFFRLDENFSAIQVKFPDGKIVPNVFLASLIQCIYSSMLKDTDRTAYNSVQSELLLNRTFASNVVFRNFESVFSGIVQDHKPFKKPFTELWIDFVLDFKYPDFEEDELDELDEVEEDSSEVLDANGEKYNRLTVYSTFEQFSKLNPTEMLNLYRDIFGTEDPNYSDLAEQTKALMLLPQRTDFGSKLTDAFYLYAKSIYQSVQHFYLAEPIKCDVRLVENLTRPMLHLLDFLYNLGLMSPSSSDSVLRQKIRSKNEENKFITLELDFLFEGRPHYFKIWAGQKPDGSIVHYVADSVESGISQNVFKSEGDVYISASCELTDPNLLNRTVLRLIRNAAVVRGKLENIFIKPDDSDNDSDIVKLLKVLYSQNLLHKKSIEIQMFY